MVLVQQIKDELPNLPNFPAIQLLCGSHIVKSVLHQSQSHYLYWIEPLIRLLGGRSYNEGRVEVNYNGEWGTVCDDGWDDTDAGVVCRQLGFGSSGTAIGSAGFGQGSGSIWLDSVTCTGSELILARCGHLGISIIRSCSHIEDAGVKCSKLQGKLLFDFMPFVYICNSKRR